MKMAESTKYSSHKDLSDAVNPTNSFSLIKYNQWMSLLYLLSGEMVNLLISSLVLIIDI